MSKRLPPNRTRPLTVTAVVLILLATYVISKENRFREVALATPERVESARPAGNSRDKAANALPELDLARLNRRKTKPIEGDLFVAKNWVPPPAIPAVPVKPAAPVAPPKPTAPALPFTYLGKLVDDDRLVIFLSRQDKNYSVSAGDKIDSTYRVEKVTESSVVFTYLPLNIQQTLTINPPQ